MNHRPVQPPQRANAGGARARLTRRRFGALSVAAGVSLLAACGGDDGPNATATASPVAGTPVAVVPGYDDPQRWKGRIVRVAALGGGVQDALRDAVFRPFSLATGCLVQEVTTDYARLASSLDAGAAYADLLLVDEIWAESALAGGFIDSIAEGEVNLTAVEPIRRIDGTSPAYAYALVSTFRRDAAERTGPPGSWADWWDGARYPGRRALPKGAFGAFEFALLADGVEPGSLYPLDGPRAIESLKRVSGAVGDLWWEEGLQPISWLSRDRADFAAAWHYRAIAGQRDGRAIDFVWDQGLLVTDRWVIARSAANRDLAIDLLGYASEPIVQASLARAVPLGPVTPAAFDVLDRRTAILLPTFPDNLTKLIPLDGAWWSSNQTAAADLFTCGILGGPCLGPASTAAPETAP